MNSRLDRLFILLDTGSNESIRIAAAKQIGEVQRIQPSDLNYLLKRVKDYSTKPVWETRIAAGHAIKYILQNVDQWPGDREESCQYIKEEIKSDVDCKQILNGFSVLEYIDQFDLTNITNLCDDLLSSEQLEADTNDEITEKGASTKTSRGRKASSSRRSHKKVEDVERQRKLINKELGIGMVDSLGIKSSDIVSNDDLIEVCEDTVKLTSNSNNEARKQARLVLKNTIDKYYKLLNQLREAGHLRKKDTESNPSCSDANSDSAVDNLEGQWPLKSITDGYIDRLFDTSWEIRHGAAIALKEIVKSQGSSAGKFLTLPKDLNTQLNQLWLIELALKGILVLSLDKFGDFLFDQVVAPVRESVAQLISCCIVHLEESFACALMRLFGSMSRSQQWERRHGAILGLKYSLNIVDKSIAKKILLECFEPIFSCLNDQMDDVSAEAAVTLVPVKDLLLETVPDKGPKLIKFLWNYLSNLDELTTSTGNMILLLSSLITTSSSELSESDLMRSIPRLWHLLGHSSTSVRISVYKALITLIKTTKSPCLSWMSEDTLIIAFRLLYQRAILENVPDVRPHLQELWLILLRMTPEEEHVQRINLLKSTSQYLNYWLCLLLQPINVAIDRGNSLWLNINADGSPSHFKPDGEIYIGSYNFNAEDTQQQKHEIIQCRLLASRLLGALYSSLVNENGDEQDIQHVKDALRYLGDMFVHHLSSKSAYQKTYSSWTLEYWALNQRELLHDKQRDVKLDKTLPKNLIDQLNIAIKELNLCYDELASSFTYLQQMARDLLNAIRRANIDISMTPISEKLVIYSLSQIQDLCDLDIDEQLLKLRAKFIKAGTSETKQNSKFVPDDLESEIRNKQVSLKSIMTTTNRIQRSLSCSVLSSLACAMIAWDLIPGEVDLVKKPLLDSISSEENQCLLNKSIRCLITLLDKLFEHQDLNQKLIDSILGCLIDWVNESALEKCSENEQSLKTATDEEFKLRRYEIVLLNNLQKQAEMRIPRRQSSISMTMNPKRSYGSMNDSSLDSYQSEQQALELRVAGAKIALTNIVKHMGHEFDVKLTNIWNCITKDLVKKIKTLKETHEPSNEAIISLVKSLNLLAVTCESIDESYRENLLHILPDIILLLNSSNPIVRHYASQCIGLITKLMFREAIGIINDQIGPMLSNSSDTLARCGAIEAIAQIIEHLQFELVSHINSFVIDILKRMSDQNDQVRLLATHCFGRLLALMPLNSELNSNPKESETIKTNNDDSTQGALPSRDIKPSISSNDKLDDQQQSSFIYQLLNPKQLTTFKVPFKMDFELRSYQQAGLNWLAFLNRFNLNGILCDEMGLGKTLMTICMIASDHYKSQLEADKRPSSAIGPSLIVCPTTLTDHWSYEIVKFLPSDVQKLLNPIIYNGSPTDRVNLRNLLTSNEGNNAEKKKNQPIFDSHNLVIGSYDIVRNDIEFFRDIQWNYCVLDEGHIIKNVKTKLSRSIRLMNANHRLILSGTPIQNNVTELWSLFDFLMPGFLGSERQFNARYTRPILQSREIKCSAREQESGALAMESLHRQVLPFILRRLKVDVLKDLPPKIIQDYYCELSSLQKKLYDDFTRSKLCQDVTKKSLLDLEADVENNHSSQANTAANPSKTKHVFQALQYLKNVCNHPKMVLTDKHPNYKEIQRQLVEEKTSVDDITHSAKLNALKQLLIDCGIGVTSQQQVSGTETNSSQSNSNQIGSDPMIALEQSIVTQHRALIFCQVRSMVNIIENDLLKKHLPTITYLKLDGSVPQNQRFSIVSRFNDDPSIDVLLLTTQIGGLGLNLTGADTVIFVEHDWNPTKDLQAMDRAHRIGQKKVVNVYRLITKGTLEEKIMGLQKFKTMVSNTVINQDNSGLSTMNVDQLLDLFDSTTTLASHNNSITRQSEVHVSNKQNDDHPKGQQQQLNNKKNAFLDFLPELWDQAQYDKEYDLSSFVSSLKC